jgi:hypothetical protein
MIRLHRILPSSKQVRSATYDSMKAEFQLHLAAEAEPGPEPEPRLERQPKSLAAEPLGVLLEDRNPAAREGGDPARARAVPNRPRRWSSAICLKRGLVNLLWLITCSCPETEIA